MYSASSRIVVRCSASIRRAYPGHDERVAHTGRKRFSEPASPLVRWRTSDRLHQHLWPGRCFGRCAAPRAAAPDPPRSRGWTLHDRGRARGAASPSPTATPGARARSRRDGLDRALVAPSSPLGVEALPADEADRCSTPTTTASPLARSLPRLGALRARRPDPAAVDAAARRGLVGLCAARRRAGRPGRHERAAARCSSGSRPRRAAARPPRPGAVAAAARRRRRRGGPR